MLCFEKLVIKTAAFSNYITSNEKLNSQMKLQKFLKSPSGYNVHGIGLDIWEA